MKKFIAISFALILTTSCSFIEVKPELKVDILSIKQKNDHYEVSLSLIRPDLNLRQPPFNIQQSDISPKVQVKNLKLNDEECDIISFPHICYTKDLEIKSEIIAEFEDHTLKSKIVFPKNGLYLEKFEILSSNEKDEATKLEFTDNFADEYSLTLKTCYLQKSCVIMPYMIVKEDGKWEIFYDIEESYHATLLTTDNIIQANFTFDPSVFSGIYYEIKAIKQWPNITNTPFTSEITKERKFESFE